MSGLWVRRRRNKVVDWWSVPPKLDNILLRRSGIERLLCFKIQALEDEFS